MRALMMMESASGGVVIAADIDGHVGSLVRGRVSRANELEPLAEEHTQERIRKDLVRVNGSE
jgi:hypothetical protein